MISPVTQWNLQLNQTTRWGQLIFLDLIYIFILPSSDHMECHQRGSQSDHVPAGQHEVQGKPSFVTLVELIIQNIIVDNICFDFFILKNTC